MGDIFDKPFDEGTLMKLNLYRGYIKEWYPVFLSSNKSYAPQNIRVYDFFAGEGKDVNGILGSPLIALEELKPYIKNIQQNNRTVKLFFSEKNKKKYQRLLGHVGNPKFCKYEVENKSFTTYFNQLYPEMISAQKNSANLMFLDQSGIKEVTKEIFLKIINVLRTDLLFYFSSSYIHRFGEMEEFKQYIDISPENLKKKPYIHIHRTILDFYRSFIPANRDYYLAPFSIKKGANIYGLIFGSNHTLGIEKFLKIAWKEDGQRGEANYDIDKDNIDLSGQQNLFPEMQIPKKIQVFEKEIEDQITTNKVITNVDAYKFGLLRGFIPKHVNVVLRKLMKENVINPVKTISGNIHRLTPERLY